jgi:hypothetical protein
LHTQHSSSFLKNSLGTLNHQIFKNTAVITGMFNSDLEVAKFAGCKLKTVSGIRGQIKKAVKEGGADKGNFRASFEDKVLMSDLVTCRVWVPVEIPNYYNPVTTLLNEGGSAGWHGMRPLAQIRKEEALKVPVNKVKIFDARSFFCANTLPTLRFRYSPFSPTSLFFVSFPLSLSLFFLFSFILLSFSSLFISSSLSFFLCFFLSLFLSLLRVNLLVQLSGLCKRRHTKSDQPFLSLVSSEILIDLYYCCIELSQQYLSYLVGLRVAVVVDLSFFSFFFTFFPLFLSFFLFFL